VWLALGAVALAAAAVGLVVAFSGSGSGPEETRDRPRREAAAPSPPPEPGVAPRGKEAPPAAARSEPPAADRGPALRSEYRRRSEKAGSKAEKIALAKWCRQNGLLEEAREAVTPLLAKQPGDVELNRLAGNRRFTGENPDYAGRWLGDAEFLKAEAAEKAFQERLLNDPKFEAMHSAVSSLRNQYLRDLELTVVKEWPYVVLIENFGTPKRMQYHHDAKAAQLRAYYRYVRETYPELTSKEPDTPFCIIIFKDRKRFLDFNKQRNNDKSEARAFYNRQSRFVYTYEKESKGRWVRPAYTIGVLYHECTHQYLDFLRPRNSLSDSCWFEEAFAEYLAGVKIVKKKDEPVPRYELGAINIEECRSIQGAIRARRNFPFVDLFRCRTYDEADSTYNLRFGEKGERRGMQLLYCQGWSFIYFCMQEPTGKYRAKFLDYVREDVAGNGDYRTLCKCFGIAGDDQWKPVEREWLAYTKKLLPPPKTRRSRKAKK